MSETEAKSICVHKLEDLLLEPMFTIFHVQHKQIASKTETQNSLIYHLKCSMAKVRGWNSTTVRDFCSNLMTRFPSLSEDFLTLFRELQHLTCKILNQSSEASTYVPLKEEVHTYLHSLISACSDAFISHTHWFAVEESSTEYQSCKNNAKVRMQQANVVENTVMNFVKAGPKLLEDARPTFNEESPSVGSVSVDGDEDDDDFGQEKESDIESDFTDESGDSRTLGKKSIDLVSGAVQEGDVDDGNQFSTPFADDPKKKKDSDSENFDSDSDSSGYDSYTTSDSSDSSGSSGSSYTTSSYNSGSSSEPSSESSSDSSSDSSDTSFDTDFDCGSSSSDTSDTGSNTSSSSNTGSEGSEDSISVGEISSDDSSEEEQPLEMLTRILSLKRKEDRYRAKKKKKI